MDHADVLADLPAPFDGEPESVRKDIADELADHLACAYRRELLLTADEQAAQQNVINKFGDPRRIARQLWFQALWGRIMLAKLKLAVPWLKYAAVAVFAWSWLMVMEQVSMMRTQSVMMAQQSASLQNQSLHQHALLQQVLQRLPQPPQPGYSEGGSSMMDAGVGMGPGGAIAFVDPADDTVPPGGFLLRLVDDREPSNPASGCVVALAREDGSRVPQLPSRYEIDAMGGGMGAPGLGSMSGAAITSTRQHPMKQYAHGGEPVVTADLGRVRFPKVEPGRYRLFIEFPEGLMCDHRLVIAPDATAEDRQLTVNCPTVDAISKAYVFFEMPPLPQALLDLGTIRCDVHLGPMLPTGSGINWQSSRESRHLTLDFDPKTGVVSGYTPFKPDFAARSFGQSQPFLGVGASSEAEVSLGDLERADRFIAVTPGRYQATLTFQQPGSEPQTIKFEKFPAAGDAVDGVLTITPETKTVKFDGPEGWQETLTKKLGGKPGSQPVNGE